MKRKHREALQQYFLDTYLKGNNMNKISVAGRLVADSELRYTTNNDAILNFRIADDVGFGDKKRR